MGDAADGLRASNGTAGNATESRLESGASAAQSKAEGGHGKANEKLAEASSLSQNKAQSWSTDSQLKSAAIDERQTNPGSSPILALGAQLPAVSPLSFETASSKDPSQGRANGYALPNENIGAWSVEPDNGKQSSKIVSVNPSVQQDAAQDGTIRIPHTSSDAYQTVDKSADYKDATDATQDSALASSSSSAVKSRPAGPDRGRSSSIFTHTRNRSGSGAGILKRFTSAKSSSELTSSSSQSLGRAISNDEPLTRSQREEKEKNRKFKTGVNLKSAEFQSQYDRDEPFMEYITPRDDTEEQERVAELADLHEMAAAGGTKAALAKTKLSSIGNPYFPTTERSAQEVSHELAFAKDQSQEKGSRRLSAMPRLSVYDLDQWQGAGPVPDNGLIPSMSVQQAIQTARQAAADSGDALMPDSEQSSNKNAGKKQKEKSNDTRRPSLSGAQESAPKKSSENTKTAKRRTFLGGLISGKKESKEPKTIVEDEEKEVETLSKPERVDTSTSMNGTRRRRFNDTRELERVASQLALESSVRQMYPEPYTISSGSRPASMMGVLAASNDFSPSANGSQTSLSMHGNMSPLSPLSMPQASFMNGKGTAHSSGGNSPMSGSPHTSGLDLSRFDGAPTRPFARSTHSGSAPSSPQTIAHAKMTGIPTDMLTGLGDGPYPALSSRFDVGDFGPSGDNDVTRGVDRGSISSSGPRSRQASLGGNAPLGAANPARRSVLQMSMVNPETEMQGLTKKPKSGKTTPFTSRSPSRNPSLTALADKFKEDAGKKTSTPAAKDGKDSGVEKSSPDTAAAGNTSKSGVFSRFSKSPNNVAGQKDKKASQSAAAPAAPASQTLKTPTPLHDQASTPSQDQSHSTNPTSSISGESTTSHSTSAATSEEAGKGESNAPERAEHVQKTPAPLDARSSSSHDQSAVSSDVAASQNATSSVTTPDVPSSQGDFSSQNLFAAPLAIAKGLAGSLSTSTPLAASSDDQHGGSATGASAATAGSSAQTITADKSEPASGQNKALPTPEASEKGKSSDVQSEGKSMQEVKSVEGTSKANTINAASSASPPTPPKSSSPSTLPKTSSKATSQASSSSKAPAQAPASGGLVARFMSRFSASNNKLGTKQSSGAASSSKGSKDGKMASSTSRQTLFSKPSLPNLKTSAWTVESDSSRMPNKSRTVNGTTNKQFKAVNVK